MVLVNFEWSWTEDGWMGCSRWGKVQQVHIGSALHNASTPLLLQPAVHQLYSNLASATPLLQVMAPPPLLASCTLCLGLQCPTTTHSSGPLCLALSRCCCSA